MKQSRHFVRSCSDGKQHISEGSKTTEQCVYKGQIPAWMLQHIQQTQRNTEVIVAKTVYLAARPKRRSPW